MREDLLKDPLIVRCLGKLEGYTIYEAEPDFVPIDRGVTIYAPSITQEIWKKVIDELVTKEDRKRLPKNIFLHKSQISTLLTWAADLIVPIDENNLVPCKDCKASGWYVGIIERYYCPTCKGAGKVAP